MTTEEIKSIADNCIGKLTDAQCRTIVHYMIGYMRHATDADLAANAFFTQIKAATEGKAIPVIW